MSSDSYYRRARREQLDLHHKVQLLICTLAPEIFMFFFTIPFALWMINIQPYVPYDGEDGIAGNEPMIFYALGILGLLFKNLLYTTFYIGHTAHNRKLSRNERGLWISLFLLSGTLGQTIYYFQHIWRSKWLSFWGF